MEESKETDICTICCNQKESSTATFVCEHTFCQPCLVSWYKDCKSKNIPRTCPLCRKIDHIWGT